MRDYGERTRKRSHSPSFQSMRVVIVVILIVRIVKTIRIRTVTVTVGIVGRFPSATPRQGHWRAAIQELRGPMELAPNPTKFIVPLK